MNSNKETDLPSKQELESLILGWFGACDVRLVAGIKLPPGHAWQRSRGKIEKKGCRVKASTFGVSLSTYRIPIPGVSEWDLMMAPETINVEIALHMPARLYRDGKTVRQWGRGDRYWALLTVETDPHWAFLETRQLAEDDRVVYADSPEALCERIIQVVNGGLQCAEQWLARQRVGASLRGLLKRRDSSDSPALVR